MGVFDTTSPAGTDSMSTVDDRIRELKIAMQESLRGGTTEGDEAVFPGSAPSTAPVFHHRGLKGTTGARPASGQYGQYFDTTRQVLQRDNGATWDDIGTVIPAGTVMCFFQAAVPTGWTQVVTQNDKVLRVVSTAGGGAGGTIATSTTLAHTHTVASHTHSFGDTTDAPSTTVVVNAGAGSLVATSDHTHVATGTSGAETPATDSQLAGALAYIDMILGSKD